MESTKIENSAVQLAKAANVKKVWGTIIFNVKDLIYAGGAVGDGTTDDTSAVQAAINDAVSKNATLLFFPPGAYKVTSLINTGTINFVGDNATFVGYAGTIQEFGVSTLNNKNTITPIYNVIGYGAKGDGVTDDTAAIQAAINEAKIVKGTVFFPPGTYKVTSTLVVTNGEYYGCRIEGANTEGVKIISYLSGTDPLFSFKGGSGAFSNVGLSNLTLQANTLYTGTAIYIDGQCYAISDNVIVNHFNYGIWLHNESAGSFSELNQFDQFNFAFCNNAIRIEQGGGNDSFHGCDFNNVYMNIGENQIGFNHVSGYLYNARFRLFMWSHNTTSVYVHCGGNAERNIGDITYESFAAGQITGNGRFFYSGFFTGIGGLVDNTAMSYQPIFACDNYWRGESYAGSGMIAYAIRKPNSLYNGLTGTIQQLIADNIESIIMNCYNGSLANGLYLGSSGFQQDLNDATLGMFLSAFGTEIKSYNPVGMDFKTSDNLSAMNIKNGRFSGNPGKAGSVSINANAGVAQNIIVPCAYQDLNSFYLFTIRIVGSNVEYRRTYMVNHNGFGGAGAAAQLSTHYEITAAGVTFTSVTADTNGNPVVNITTDRALTIIYKAMGIGIF